MGDEAGQATEPATAVLMASGVLGAHTVLIGDDAQLPPTVLDRAAVWGGLTTSLLARLIRAHGGQPHVVTLLRQYRMHPDIMEFPSAMHYGGRLVAGLDRIPGCIGGLAWPRREALEGEREQDARHRVVVIHTDAQGSRPQRSIVNEGQAAIIGELFQHLLPPEGEIIRNRIRHGRHNETQRFNKAFLNDRGLAS